MFLSGIGQWAPRAENAKIDVKVIGASQEMCNYLPLLQKLPAALVIRKVKVTKHSSFKGRVLSRTTLCAFSSFGKGKIIAHNLGTKIGLISHIYFGIFCTGCPRDICTTSSDLKHCKEPDRLYRGQTRCARRCLSRRKCRQATRPCIGEH